MPRNVTTCERGHDLTDPKNVRIVTARRSGRLTDIRMCVQCMSRKLQPSQQLEVASAQIVDQLLAISDELQRSPTPWERAELLDRQRVLDRDGGLRHRRASGEGGSGNRGEGRSAGQGHVLALSLAGGVSCRPPALPPYAKAGREINAPPRHAGPASAGRDAAPHWR